MFMPSNSHGPRIHRGAGASFRSVDGTTPASSEGLVLYLLPRLLNRLTVFLKTGVLKLPKRSVIAITDRLTRDRYHARSLL
jgi:hypothetical protein